MTSAPSHGPVLICVFYSVESKREHSYSGLRRSGPAGFSIDASEPSIIDRTRQLQSQRRPPSEAGALVPTFDPPAAPSSDPDPG